MRDCIATVFSPRPNRVISTYANHRVEIRGGTGKVYDARSLHTLFKMPELTIEIEPDKADWVQGWVDELGDRTPLQAEVRIGGEHWEDYLVAKAVTMARLAEEETSPKNKGGRPKKAPPVEPVTPPAASDGWTPPEGFLSVEDSTPASS